MKVIYKGFELIPYCEKVGYLRYWHVKEASTGLNITVRGNKAPRKRVDAEMEAFNNIDEFGVDKVNEAIATAKSKGFVTA